jgi:hypothetical protein
MGAAFGLLLGRALTVFCVAAGRAVMGAAFGLLLGRALTVYCVAAGRAVMAAAGLLRAALAVFCMAAGGAVMGTTVFVFTHKNHLLIQYLPMGIHNYYHTLFLRKVQ